MNERRRRRRKEMAVRAGELLAATRATLNCARTNANGDTLTAQQVKKASGARANANTGNPKTLPSPTHPIYVLCNRQVPTQHETPTHEVPVSATGIHAELRSAHAARAISIRIDRRWRKQTSLRPKRESDGDASKAPARSKARDKTTALTTVRPRTVSPVRSVD
jgi:hypothetical protein